MTDSLVLLSGGIDSCVVLAQEVHSGRRPRWLAIDYGQRHRRELDSAQAIAAHYGLQHHGQVATLPSGILGGSALTGDAPVPSGLAPTHPGQSVTVVPGRNLLFLSLAVAVAASARLPSVLIGCNFDDRAIYADSRASFLGLIDHAASSVYGVNVYAPLAGITKAEVVRMGRHLGAPLHLCWSCYQGGEAPCGQCGACKTLSAAG